MKRIKAIITSPIVHVLLPLGVVAYLRFTTGQWPSIEAIALGGTLLLARAKALSEVIRMAIPAKPEPEDEPDPEPAPEKAPE